MFSLRHVAILGVFAMASAIDYEYKVSLYDYSADLKANNTIFYTPVNGQFFYKFTVFPAGFHHYYDYPTLVVYQPEGLKELHGYYYPQGFRTLFSYGEGTTFFDRYTPIREYFLKGRLAAFTPAAAFQKYKYFYEYYLKKFVYGDDVPTEFAVVFVTPFEEVPSEYKEVERYGYDGKIFEKIIF